MAKKTDITVQTFVLADMVITAEDKKNSIIGIFDKIFVRDLPAKHSRMAVFITLVGKAEEKEKIELEIVKPSGQSELKQPLEFKLGLNSKANLVMNLEGFPVTELGSYSIVLNYDGNKLAEYSLDVIKVKGQEQNNQLVN